MINTATLFLNAPLPPKNNFDPLLPQIQNSDIYCADGGYMFAHKLPVKVKAVIGDLDTIEASGLSIPDDIELIKKPSQELNDFEKSLIYFKEHGYTKIYLFGITGERTDHVLTNFSVLSRYLKYFKFEIYG